MADAIVEAGNATNGQVDQRTKEQRLEDAQKAGWCAPQPFNYDAAAPTSGMHGATGGEGANNEDAYKATAWAHDAEKYEWQEDYGEVGPRHEELEKQLFRTEYHNRAGDKFKK